MPPLDNFPASVKAFVQPVQAPDIGRCWHGRGEVLPQGIRRNVEGVVTVGGALELPAADDPDAVLAQ